jgi:hypothetical protein
MLMKKELNLEVLRIVFVAKIVFYNILTFQNGYGVVVLKWRQEMKKRIVKNGKLSSKSELWASFLYPTRRVVLNMRGKMIKLKKKTALCIFETTGSKG